jgi:phosphoglycolate phosphatase
LNDESRILAAIGACMITTIIFDVDGVLDDNYELHYSLSCKKTKDLTREEHRRLFEGNIHEERANLAHRDTGFDMVKEFNATRIGKSMNPDTIDLLHRLYHNYRLGIISSGTESSIREFLRHNDCIDCFSFIYGVETHKSKEEKLKLLSKEFHVTNLECIFITDTLGDINEANALGIRAIGYICGYHERSRLEKGNPFAIIDDLSQIESVVQSIR